MSSIININSLTKVYHKTDTTAVDNIDLIIKKGDFFGLLGPNGAGKTTTVSMMSSLMKPTSGSIEISGVDIESGLNSIRRQIGVVPQEISLYPKLNACENLKFFGRMYGMDKKILHEKIKEYLKVFGLDSKAKQLVETYSGGMKRRLNLIAGILHSPEIIFLDEPTVGIDVQSRKVIMQYLLEMKKNGKTLVYTSHHMEEAEKYCNKIAIIDNGKIIANGPPDELLEAHKDCNDLEDVFLELTGRKLRD